MNVLTANARELQDSASSVNVLELADSSVIFTVRPCSTVAEYWAVYFGITEQCKEALDVAGTEIPYTHQVELHKEA